MVRVDCAHAIWNERGRENANMILCIGMYIFFEGIEDILFGKSK